MVKVAVVGARGYLGRISIQLLLGHPEVDAVVPVSNSRAGDPLGAHVPALRHVDGLTLVAPDDPAVTDADAVLLATATGEAASLMPDLDGGGVPLVIDLSRDHRHAALTGAGGWSYGLPELPPGTPKGADRIANPGCYPTATLIGAAPLVAAGLSAPGPVIVDGISGVSGAGATPRPDLHFPETNESVRAYKVLGHDHTDEMRLGLARAATGRAPTGIDGTAPVRFTPHLVPQNRGLLCTVYLPAADGVTNDDVVAAYDKAYAHAPFVRVVPEPDTGIVRGSNFCDVAATVDPDTGLIVVRSAIDNLVKGGAGTAVQNLNLALGWPETAGLTATGGGP